MDCSHSAAFARISFWSVFWSSTPRRENAVSNVIVHAQLHGKRLFLPDDFRHLRKQPPKPLISPPPASRFPLFSWFCFRISSVTSAAVICVYRAPAFCCDLLLRKSAALFRSESGKSKGADPDSTHLPAAPAGALCISAQRLYTAFLQPVRNGKHPAVDEPHHAVFIRKSRPQWGDCQNSP